MRCASRIHSKVGLRAGAVRSLSAVLLGNAPADAVDAGLQGRVGITHQRDEGPIAVLETPHEGFPEEGLDVEAVGMITASIG